MAKQNELYLAMEDFPEAINVTIENGWIVVWLSTCRIKFRNWKSNG